MAPIGNIISHDIKVRRHAANASVVIIKAKYLQVFPTEIIVNMNHELTLSDQEVI